MEILSRAHTTLLLGEAFAAKKLALDETARQLCHAHNAPCGECAVCRRIYAGEHPDVHILDRGTSSIKIDDVRQFLAEEHIRAYEAPFKVYIIVHADTMNQASQNSLLKTLEEPDGDTRFYLIAQRSDGLLPTILSRCAIRRVASIAAEELSRRLQDDGVTAFCAQMSAMLADGSMRRAQEISGDTAFFELGKRAADAFCTAMAKEGVSVSPLYAFVNKKEDAIVAVTWWRAVLHDILLQCTGGTGMQYFSEKPKDFDTCARRIGAHGASNLLRALDQVQMQIEGNISAPLAADGFFYAAMKEKKS